MSVLEAMQKEKRMKFLFSAAVISLVLFLCDSSALCEDQSAEHKTSAPQSRFVDLDGDGLNDNVADENNDGLPDFGKKEAPQRQFTVRGVTTDIFKGLESNDAPIKLFLSNSDRFRSLKFCTRSLAQCRGGFTSGDEFGPGNGIGQGALSGHCAGGVCRF
jgi:hypothetical protein